MGILDQYMSEPSTDNVAIAVKPSSIINQYMTTDEKPVDNKIPNPPISPDTNKPNILSFCFINI